MAPAPVTFHRARTPLLRRRSWRQWHGWMAPGQAALHRARTPLLRRRSRRPRHCWMAPASAALDRARPPLLRRRSSLPAPWRMAPMPAEVGRARRSPLGAAVGSAALLDGRPRRRRSSGASPLWFLCARFAGAEVRVRRLGGWLLCARRRAGLAGRHFGAAAGTWCVPDGGPPDASAGAAAHPTRDSVHSRHQSPPRRHIPAAVRRHIWQRDGGRCCYRDPLSGRRCTSSHLLQIDHLLPVAQGGGPEPSNLVLRCFAHHRMRHGYGPAAPPEPPM